MPNNELNGLPGTCARCPVRALWRGFPEALLIADAEGRVLLLNRAAEALLGLQEEDLLFQPLQPHLKDPSLSQFWQEALVSGQAVCASLLLGQPPRWVNASAPPFPPTLEAGGGTLFRFWKKSPE
jgi:PAS domain-containing protein